MPIPSKLQEVLDTLAMLSDRADRIDALISIAEQFIPVPKSIAAPPYPEERRVPGCESQAFVFTVPLEDGTLRFEFAVENPQGVSAMALASILHDSLSGAPLEEVTAVPDDVVYEIFGRELSMGKSMGLTNMVQMVRAKARAAMSRSRPNT